MRGRMNTSTDESSTHDQSSPFHEAVVTYLERNGHVFLVDQFKSRALYKYSVVPEDLETDPIDVEIFIKPYTSSFSLFAYSPNKIALEHRAYLLDHFAASNFNHDAINTELDPSTGTVRCGFAFYLLDECVSPTLLSRMEKHATLMITTLGPMLETYSGD